MDTLRIFLPFIGIGLVYFLLIMFLKTKFKISYLTGMWLPLGLVVLFIALSIYARLNPQPGSWSDLISAALASVLFVTLATYVVAWGIVTLVGKRNQSKNR